MNRVTLSKLELLTRCQAWAKAGAEWSEHTSDDAALGTEVDRLFCSYIEDPASHYDASYLQHERTDPIFARLREWVDAERDVSWRTQVVYAYDVATDTGRCIARPDDAPSRFYAEPEWRARLGILDTEICGAADLVECTVVAGEMTLTICDLKVKVGVAVKDATAQLAGLALAACRSHGVTGARIVTLVASESKVEEHPLQLDAFDLDAMAGEIAARVGAIETSEPTPGDWCTERYCPHLAHCSATTGAAASAEQLISVDRLTARDGEYRMGLHVSSPDHAAWLLHRARAVERVCEEIRAKVAEYAGEDGVRLEDGSTLKPTFRNMPRLNVGALEEVAKRYGATDEDIAGCVRVVRENAGLRVVKGQAKKGRAA